MEEREPKSTKSYKTVLSLVRWPNYFERQIILHPNNYLSSCIALSKPSYALHFENIDFLRDLYFSAQLFKKERSNQKIYKRLISEVFILERLWLWLPTYIDLIRRSKSLGHTHR